MAELRDDGLSWREVSAIMGRSPPSCISEYNRTFGLTGRTVSVERCPRCALAMPCNQCLESSDWHALRRHGAASGIQ